MDGMKNHFTRFRHYENTMKQNREKDIKREIEYFRKMSDKREREMVDREKTRKKRH